MKIRNKTKIASILFFLMSFVSSATMLQPPPPPPPGLPIDGGVLAVFMLGLFYGIRKRMNR